MAYRSFDVIESLFISKNKKCPWIIDTKYPFTYFLDASNKEIRN